MTAATVAFLFQNRTGGPAQTPVVRRTGPIQPIEPPKKKNTFATVLPLCFSLVWNHTMAAISCAGIFRPRTNATIRRKQDAVPDGTRSSHPS